MTWHRNKIGAGLVLAALSACGPVNETLSEGWESSSSGVGGAFAGGENTPDLCADGVDNDGDGKVDCADAECIVQFSSSLCKNAGPAGSGGATASSGTGGTSGDEDGDSPGVDADADGWGAEWGDCDDGDPTINPGAPEQSGDGIDQNCNGLIDEELGGGSIVDTDKVAGVDYCYASSFRLPVGGGNALDHCINGDGWYVYTEFHAKSPCGKATITTHLGEDWNGESGGSTDLGSSVYAVGNGVVVFTKTTTGDAWGRVVIVRHDPPLGTSFTLPGGGVAGYVVSQYAHLQNLAVVKGQAVSKGQKIAEIGPHPDSPHLHWEISGPNATLFPGPGYSTSTLGRVNPTQFVTANMTISVTCGGENEPCCQTSCGGSKTCDTGLSCNASNTCVSQSANCGNGIKQPGEECDGTQLGGATCQTQGYDGGSLSCSIATCTFDTSACCDDTCPQKDATHCASSTVMQTCGFKSNGCLGWGGDVICPAGCDPVTNKCKPTCNGGCNSPPNAQCYEPSGMCVGNACVYTPKPYGTSCSDGNSCTSGDVCNGNGSCGGSPLQCNSPPNVQCYNAVGTCSGGSCSYVPRPYGTSCSDGNSCTSGDTCDGNGSCAGSPLQCNNPPNSQCYQSIGMCSGGACSYAPKPYGTACDDGNPGTSGDICNGNGTCSGCSPSIISVSPLSATLNQPTTFTITGTCLPSTIAPFIPECANLLVTSTGPTQATFQCTPSYSTGIKSGLVKDKPGGTVLYTFNVNVLPCTAVVNTVTPTTAQLNNLTVFTITGSCLPSTIAPFIPECANLVVTSTGPTQAKFQCTPSYTTGVKSGVVKDQPGGTVLKNFTVTVY